MILSYLSTTNFHCCATKCQQTFKGSILSKGSCSINLCSSLLKNTILIDMVDRLVGTWLTGVKQRD